MVLFFKLVGSGIWGVCEFGVLAFSAQSRAQSSLLTFFNWRTAEELVYSLVVWSWPSCKVATFTVIASQRGLSVLSSLALHVHRRVHAFTIYICSIIMKQVMECCSDPSPLYDAHVQYYFMFCFLLHIIFHYIFLHSKSHWFTLLLMHYQSSRFPGTADMNKSCRSAFTQGRFFSDLLKSRIINLPAWSILHLHPSGLTCEWWKAMAFDPHCCQGKESATVARMRAETKGGFNSHPR